MHRISLSLAGNPCERYRRVTGKMFKLVLPGRTLSATPMEGCRSAESHSISWIQIMKPTRRDDRGITHNLYGGDNETQV